MIKSCFVKFFVDLSQDHSVDVSCRRFDLLLSRLEVKHSIFDASTSTEQVEVNLEELTSMNRVRAEAVHVGVRSAQVTELLSALIRIATPEASTHSIGYTLNRGKAHRTDCREDGRIAHR